MIFVSSLLREKYPRDAENIFSAFAEFDIFPHLSIVCVISAIALKL